MLKFITGNSGKFKEAVIMLAPFKVSMLDIKTEEIQSLDHQKVVQHKLAQALAKKHRDFFIEDTCIYFQGLKNKLPGPYGRSFLEALGFNGIYDLVRRLNSPKAEMVSIIGFCDSRGRVKFFQSNVKGTIVKPKGDFGFGYDSVFMPQKTGQTLAQLKAKGLYHYSPRCGAIKKLKQYLQG